MLVVKMDRGTWSLFEIVIYTGGTQYTKAMDFSCQQAVGMSMIEVCGDGGGVWRGRREHLIFQHLHYLDLKFDKQYISLDTTNSVPFHTTY